jgi:hypothetical protein
MIEMISAWKRHRAEIKKARCLKKTPPRFDTERGMVSELKIRICQYFGAK